jgi:ATP-dependent DNA helicase RecG
LAQTGSADRCHVCQTAGDRRAGSHYRRARSVLFVCGFANALGGKIFIGLNDTGEVVGVGNYRELMESIPNKIHDFLGI